MKKHFSPNSSLLETEIEFKYKVFPVTNETSKIISQKSLIKLDSINPKMFFLNIQLLDSELPRILSEILLLKHDHFKTTTSDLLALIENKNPIAYNQQKGHQFYRKKLGDLLYCLAMGMNSKMVWEGHANTDIEFVFEGRSSDKISFTAYDRNLFQNYLINHTKFEQASKGEDGNNPGSPKTKTGSKNYYDRIYKEDGEFFLKLNLQIRFT